MIKVKWKNKHNLVTFADVQVGELFRLLLTNSGEEELGSGLYMKMHRIVGKDCLVNTVTLVDGSSGFTEDDRTVVVAKSAELTVAF
jgi:hypothetical protein